MAEFSFFCYICKKHITIVAKNAKEAQQTFHTEGHSDEKVSQLRKGLVGK